MRHAPLSLCSPLILLMLCLGVSACHRATTTSHPHNIFGDDTRKAVDTSLYPYSTIGRLDAGCSGVMVGKRLAVTAAHCLLQEDGVTLREKMGLFRLFIGASDDPIDTAQIEQAWLGTRTPLDDRPNDWAILRLDQSFGVSYGTMLVGETQAVDGFYPTALVSLAGYSHDMDDGNHLSVSQCHIQEVKDGRLLHNCDSTSGVSGGPLYVMDGTYAKIVGLTVSEYRDNAQDSLTREQYSEDYANVGIPTQALAGALQRLIDMGMDDDRIAAPDDPGIEIAVSHANFRERRPPMAGPGAEAARRRLAHYAGRMRSTSKNLAERAQVLGISDFAAKAMAFSQAADNLQANARTETATPLMDAAATLNTVFNNTMNEARNFVHNPDTRTVIEQNQRLRTWFLHLRRAIRDTHRVYEGYPPATR